MHRTNFDLAHEVIREIEGRFHFAIFPESWFYVNNGPIESPAASRSRRRPGLCRRCAASAQRRSFAGSWLLPFAELLKARIVPKRIEHRIEPQHRGSERHGRGSAAGGDQEKLHHCVICSLLLLLAP